LKRLAHLLHGREAAGVDQGPLDRRVDVLEEADHVLRAHHRAGPARPAAVVLAVDSEDRVRDRSGEPAPWARGASLVHGVSSLPLLRMSARGRRSGVSTYGRLFRTI